MSQIPPIPQPVQPVSVEMDISCRKCAYNLRGLRLDGRCPECGTPVGVSVNGELLRYSDPEFLNTLRKGISFILWGILAMIVVSVVTTLGARAGIPRILAQMLWFITGLLQVAGGWLLTTPDPSGIGEDQYGALRKLVRISLALGVSNSLLTLIVTASGPLTPSLGILFTTIEIILGLAGLIGTIAQLIYLKKLALRIPNPSLSKEANSVCWGIGILYGLFLLAGAILALAAAAGVARGAARGAAAQSPLMVFGCVVGILGIALFVYGIMYILMLRRFGRSIDEQAVLARAVWSQAVRANPQAQILAE